jgi:hypothetical protein
MYEVFLSHLSIMTLAAYLGTGARDYPDSHREEARRRISDKADELQFEFREVLVEFVARHDQAQCCVSAPQGDCRRLFDMGLLQEMGSVKLHLASLDSTTSPKTQSASR